jgi:nitrogen fixation protein NifB
MDLALKLCPEIKVAGVAGPGDPLAGPEGLETLILIKERYPHLMTCLSTNGLALAESMDRILLAGVRTLTVTVNALEPAVLEVINRGVIEEGRFLGGRLGARRLIAAQEEGIRLAGEAGLTVKINMVLIPGVNDGQTERIAQSAREWGASLMNIIPLIPANDLAGCPAPTEAETEAAVRTAEKHLPVKRNCRRCRADACGIIGGEDYGPLLYGHLNPAETFSHG